MLEKLTKVVGLLRAAHLAFVAEACEEGFAENISKASVAVGDIFCELQKRENCNLRKYIEAVHRGLLRAKEMEFCDYFQPNEIVELADSLEYVSAHLVTDLSDADYNSVCDTLFQVLPDIMDEISEEQYSSTGILDYRIDFPLEQGVGASIVFHNLEEVCLSFEHKLCQVDDQDNSKVIMSNDTKLVVAYHEGISADEIVLSMHIIIPSRFGVKYAYGLDISPGAKNFLQFHYRKVKINNENYYRLFLVTLGATKRFNLDEVKDGLIVPINFPFPVLDVLEDEGWGYRVPFIDEEGNEGFFQFSEDIRKTAKELQFRKKSGL